MFKLLKNCHIETFLSYRICIRWYATKPRWVPIAKTKEWRVHQRPQYLPGEYEEVSRLYKNYSSHLKSCIALIKDLHIQNETSQEVIDKEEQEKELLWLEAMKVNEEWNRQVAIEREEWERLTLEEDIQKARERKAQEDKKRFQDQESIDALIKEQQELSKNFITEDNIDSHIDKILNSPPHIFHYALDVKGNIYDGFSMYPTRIVDETGQFKDCFSSDENKKMVSSLENN